MSERSPEDLWPAVRGWSAQLGPFWIEAIRRFADVAGLPVARCDRHLTAAESAFELMDGWWSGRTRLVKARRNEIDSAISFIRNTALRGELRFLLQAPIARHVAGALRGCLNIAAGSYHRSQMPEVTASLVYDWAACRTLFPGDPSVLLQHVPSADQVPGNGPDAFDNHHLLYGEPADLFDLRQEADAVLAEVCAIWDSFDAPLAWVLPRDLWTRPYDGRYHAMYYDELQAFHARNGRT